MGDVTGGNTKLAFSVQFIFWFNLGLQDIKWEGNEARLRNLEARETYQRAMARTGHHLQI